MAIPFITIELDKPYKLRFGMGAQVEFEQTSGMKIKDLGKELETGLSATTLSRVLFVMLRKEDKSLTLEAVYDLVDDYADNMPYITEKVSQAIIAAYEVKDAQKNEIPPEAVSLNG